MITHIKAHCVDTLPYHFSGKSNFIIISGPSPSILFPQQCNFVSLCCCRSQFIIITPTLLCYIDYIIKNKHLEYLIFDPTDNNNNYATHIKSLSSLSSSSLSSFKFISLCAQIPHHLSPTLPSDNTFSFLRTNDDADDDNDDADDGDRIDIANR